MKSVIQCQDYMNNPICSYKGVDSMCEYSGFCEFQRPRDDRKEIECE